MAFRHWHPGKLVMFWLMCLGGSAASFAFSVVADEEGWWVLFAAFLGSGIALAVAPWVVTWKWFDARDMQREHKSFVGKLMNMDRLFSVFWFSYCVAIPLLYRFARKARDRRAGRALWRLWRAQPRAERLIRKSWVACGKSLDQWATQVKNFSSEKERLSYGAAALLDGFARVPSDPGEI